MKECLKIMARRRTRSDWIIALTDGDDNNSAALRCTADTVKEILQSMDIGVIIIGVGADVKSEARKVFKILKSQESISDFRCFKVSHQRRRMERENICLQKGAEGASTRPSDRPLN